MAKKGTLIWGVGINDADYAVSKNGIVDGKRRSIWKCPFYNRWLDMMRRAYSDKYKEKFPTYKDCYVCDEWLYFSNFKAWMEQQDWEGKHLDKDILFPGNKIYSSENCVFVSPNINLFLTDCASSRGNYPIGVDFETKANKFRATCRSVVSGKQEFLGYFNCPEEAHLKWRKFKLEQAKILSLSENNPKVVDALISRYSI